MTAGKRLTVDEIAAIVIGLLAENAGVPADQMRAGLMVGGPELPVDSVLVVEVLARTGEACGVRIPLNEETAMSTGSVMAFARTVHKAIPLEGETA